MKEGEQVDIEMELETSLMAPVAKDRKVGKIVYRLGDEVVAFSEIRTAEAVGRRDFKWCFLKTAEQFWDGF